MRSGNRYSGETQTSSRAGEYSTVIECCDRITIEADQRHVREIMKGLEVERANHSAMWQGGMKTRRRTDADEGRPSTDGMM